jgi:hypothetical protein
MSQPEKLSLFWTIFDELRAHQAKPITMIFRRSSGIELETVFVYGLNRSIRVCLEIRIRREAAKRR